MYTELIKRKIAYATLSTFLSRKVYGTVDTQKEKEIVVWFRLQKNIDKDQFVDFANTKFNLDEKDAERIYYIAFPDRFDTKDEEEICSINQRLLPIPRRNVDEILDLSIDVVLQKDDGIAVEVNPEILLSLNDIFMNRKILNDC